MKRFEMLNPKQLANAVAIYLWYIRGVPLKAIGETRFPVYDGQGTPHAIAEVDLDVERSLRSPGSGESRVPEVADEGAGG